MKASGQDLCVVFSYRYLSSYNLCNVYVLHRLFQMLKVYQQHLDKNMIPYYWNRNNNLIKGVSPETINNIKQRISKIVMDIERNSTDPYVMIKYLRKLCFLIIYLTRPLNVLFCSNT